MSLDVTPLPGQLVITDREFQQFRALVRQHAGIALGDTKRQLVCSRLGRRLRHYGYTTFSQYYRHLMEEDPDGQELVRMINAITTNKTEFFREAHHFAFLRSVVLPGLAEAHRGAATRRLRIWSAGCSSGEEPFSIALTMLAALPDVWSWDARILASDIDTDMLARGEKGVYPVEQVAHVPPAMVQEHFLRGKGGREGLVCVRPGPRRLVSFRRINLQDEPWPIRTAFDAIFCRNVIIYFDRALQQRLIARFIELLKPGGYLFLGHAESLLGMGLGLTYVGNTVYQKTSGADEATTRQESSHG
jgi:chemotaxis protein methyltransferase CheR